VGKRIWQRDDGQWDWNWRDDPSEDGFGPFATEEEAREDAREAACESAEAARRGMD
jgi:hypothetical protein